jgi:hypothetical protein
MKIFMFEADLYCGPCGESIRSTIDTKELEYPSPEEWHYNDSNTWPIEYDSSEGESDSPDHCGNYECGLFLERRLTDDGIKYVKEAVDDRKFGYDIHGRNEIVKQWVEFYQIEV